ncbi:hypothetical protein VL20_4828 [Microcystis panniformis FACHB-1757]|uniref:Uncharacterized protein n=1 Tax=Microcystis panniformis FACHB-1757 TaxID=1638788 RepID=A0A0K1S6R9_9CHRO|nr:hypothetical protein VL20_4828 [Microcystis panniformis FACHB-1757]
MVKKTKLKFAVTHHLCHQGRLLRARYQKPLKKREETRVSSPL